MRQPYLEVGSQEGEWERKERAGKKAAWCQLPPGSTQGDSEASIPSLGHLTEPLPLLSPDPHQSLFCGKL